MVSERAVIEILRRYRIASCYKGFFPLISLVTESACTDVLSAPHLREIAEQYHIPLPTLRQRVRIIARCMEKNDPQGFYALLGSEQYSLESFVQGLYREAEQASKSKNLPPS